MSWMDFLKTSPVEWLLEVKDSPVRYQTLLDIVGVDPTDLEIQLAEMVIDAVASVAPWTRPRFSPPPAITTL